jgi:hypothetical protein
MGLAFNVPFAGGGAARRQARRMNRKPLATAENRRFVHAISNS